jgi:hypothetical protein
MSIATTKTTVLGIRLDHDRRAWVEDAAARDGVTVRAFFERMIDEARADEMAVFLGVDVAPQAAGQESVLAGPEPDQEPARDDHAEGVTVPPAPATVASGTSPTPAPSLCDDVLELVAVPRRVVEAATSFTATLFRAGCRLVPRAVSELVRERVPGWDLRS